jgi:hypothetical protein
VVGGLRPDQLVVMSTDWPVALVGHFDLLVEPLDVTSFQAIRCSRELMRSRGRVPVRAHLHYLPAGERGFLVWSVLPMFCTASFTEILDASAAFLRSV